MVEDGAGLSPMKTKQQLDVGSWDKTVRRTQLSQNLGNMDLTLLNQLP